jgi:hypothetical protein
LKLLHVARNLLLNANKFLQQDEHTRLCVKRLIDRLPFPHR